MSPALQLIYASVLILYPLIYRDVCVYEYACAGVCRSEDNRRVLIFSFCHVGSGC